MQAQQGEQDIRVEEEDRGRLLRGGFRQPLNRVFIYMDTPPQTTGSGAHLRLYSNVRAYLDLGFDVEVVHFTANPERSVPDPGLEGLRWSQADAEPQASSLLGRLEFRAGLQEMYGAAAQDVRDAFVEFLGTCPLAVRLANGVFVCHGSPAVPESSGSNTNVSFRKQVPPRTCTFSAHWGATEARSLSASSGGQ